MDRKEFLVGVPAVTLAGCSSAETRVVLDVDFPVSVAWYRDYKGTTMEYAIFHQNSKGWQIDGEVTGALSGVPLRAKYSVSMNAFSRVQWCIVDASYGEQRHREVLSGKNFEALDFALTPSTNTIAINQLGLKIGESREITVAFVDFPSLRVTWQRQSYARISENGYKYHNLVSGFQATLHVGAANIVGQYERVWQRIGNSAAGPRCALDDARVRTFATALASAKPSSELTIAELFDLDWLIGGWAGEVRDYDEGGSERVSRGEWWFSWVLEGRAMQDVWMVPNSRYGSTLRCFDWADGLWHVSWRNPVSGAHNELAGRRRGDAMVLEGTADGARIRWSFLDIQNSKMHWTGEERISDGTWKLRSEFFLNRLA